MENTIPYPVKHWLATLAIGPLVLVIYDSISSFNFVFAATGVFLLFLIFGLFLSLPVFGVYFWAYKQLVKTTLSGLAIKIILTLLAVIGIAGTFALIQGSMAIRTGFSYSIALFISSTFWRTRSSERIE